MSWKFRRDIHFANDRLSDIRVPLKIHKIGHIQLLIDWINRDRIRGARGPIQNDLRHRTIIVHRRIQIHFTDLKHGRVLGCFTSVDGGKVQLSVVTALVVVYIDNVHRSREVKEILHFYSDEKQRSVFYTTKVIVVGGILTKFVIVGLETGEEGLRGFLFVGPYVDSRLSPSEGMVHWPYSVFCNDALSVMVSSHYQS